MRGKFEGQNLLFIVMLALIVLLSYCSIPHKDKTQDPWETAKIEHMKRTAVHHDASDKKDSAHGEIHGDAPEVVETEKILTEPAMEAPAKMVAHEKEVVHETPVKAHEAETPTQAVEPVVKETKEPVTAEPVAHEAAPAVVDTPAPTTPEEAAPEEAAPADAAPADAAPADAAEVAPVAPAPATTGAPADVMAMENASYPKHKKTHCYLYP